MRLRYTRPALRDLEALLDYIAEHDPSSAERMHERIKGLSPNYSCDIR